MRTVLLADGAASVRDLAKVLLERDELVFEEATDATEALAAVAVYRPSLVLLDLDLPPCGGLEVLRKIRALDEVPVVILALREHAVEARKLYTYGAAEILLKPIDAWKLVAAAESALAADLAERSAFTARRA